MAAWPERQLPTLLCVGRALSSTRTCDMNRNFTGNICWMLSRHLLYGLTYGWSWKKRKLLEPRNRNLDFNVGLRLLLGACMSHLSWPQHWSLSQSDSPSE